MLKAECVADIKEVWTKIEVQHKFLDLGDRSFAAIKLVERVIKRFQSNLPLKVLFESPTVAQMAKVSPNIEGHEVGNDDGGRNAKTARHVLKSNKKKGRED